VFCGDGSNMTFTDCRMINNRATYYADSYTGYGGGICFGAEYVDDPQQLRAWSFTIAGPSFIFDSSIDQQGFAQLSGCKFENNSASIGGGVYGLNIEGFGVYDCNFLDNTAYMGGCGLKIASSLTMQ